jgi:hypothetical protein
VCNVIKAGDEDLFKRITHSKQFEKGGEPLTDIARDYQGKFTYQSLFLHCKKHQAPTAEELIGRRMQRYKEVAMVQQYQRAITTREKRAALIDRLYEKLENGEFDDQMTVKDLLTALRDSDNIEAKKKDQDIDILKMMMPYRSGEANIVEGEFEEFNPWEQ